jgi:hypothetical protein
VSAREESFLSALAAALNEVAGAAPSLAAHRNRLLQVAAR